MGKQPNDMFSFYTSTEHSDVFAPRNVIRRFIPNLPPDRPSVLFGRFYSTRTRPVAYFKRVLTPFNLLPVGTFRFNKFKILSRGNGLLYFISFPSPKSKSLYHSISALGNSPCRYAQHFGLKPAFDSLCSYKTRERFVRMYTRIQHPPR